MAGGARSHGFLGHFHAHSNAGSRAGALAIGPRCPRAGCV